MDSIVYEYIRYLSGLDTIKKPIMPEFSLAAYTDSEYVSAVDEIMNDFDSINDSEITLDFILKGD